MIRKYGSVAVALALSLTVASRARADGPRLAATGGIGSAYGHTYYEVGGRLGYDLGLGFTPEVGMAYWSGSTPNFWQLTTGITWYLPLPVLRPYVGGFYAHEFVNNGYPDQDALGARGGIGLAGLGPLSVSVGVAYSRHLSCPADCDTWWPEASASLSF